MQRKRNPCALLVGMENGIQLLWKTVWQFLKKFKIELLYDPAIVLMDIYPKEFKAKS